jgi:hypothetical protein
MVRELAVASKAVVYSGKVRIAGPLSAATVVYIVEIMLHQL